VVDVNVLYHLLPSTHRPHEGSGNLRGGRRLNGVSLIFPAKRIGVERLAPHDLRRTCARLCHGAGGELEQIQFLLGHASVQTTERYIGCQRNFREGVNDRFQISLANNNAS
jgi:integrase